MYIYSYTITKRHAMKKQIKVKDLPIRLADFDGGKYFNLSDLAKKRNERPEIAIQSWMRTRSTIIFLKTWEQFNNADFKHSKSAVFKGFQAIEEEFLSENSFNLSPTKWIAYTNATGIIVKKGRYGGTWAHEDIALEFASWISAEFKLYVLQEFKRLKAQEALALGDPSDLKRHLATGNYSLLVHSLLMNMDERLLTHPQPYKKRLPLASEADMLNEIVFGQTAKSWRSNNADKPIDRNQRDYATVLELIVLNNLEFLDAMLLQWDCDKKERQQILQEAYDFQYPILKRSKTIKRLKDLSKRIEKGD